MIPGGLLRVCSVAALATGGIGMLMPAAAACEVRYNATSVSLISCAAEEQACEYRGLAYGTIEHVQCVAALGEKVIRVPERRATPPAGMQQTPPPSIAPNRRP